MNPPLLFRLLVCYLILGGVTNSSAQKFKPKYLRENDKALLQYTSQATDDGWLDFKADGDAVDAQSLL